MPRAPQDSDVQQDKLRNKVARGLRAEQALPFIRPYLDARLADLSKTLNHHAINSNKDKVFETSIRISEVQNILDEIRVQTVIGKQADQELAEGRA